MTGGIVSDAVILSDGWAAHNIWDHSSALRELYRRRARDEAEEMTCAAQAAELLRLLAKPGESVLDMGCGSGNLYHALRRRNIPLAYYGVDATAAFIEIAKRELAAFGLPPDRMHVMRIEDFRGAADHVVSMNVLSNIDNFHRPLERMLQAARRSLVLRESIKDGGAISYVRDEFLDPGVNLKVHVNAYDRAEITQFICSNGFSVEEVIDVRSAGKPEHVIGHLHYWTFLIARRISGGPASAS
jgi:SAM-dependent methyltransferase